MKTFIIFIISIFPTLVFSQSFNDVIILNSQDSIKCNILNVESEKIKYEYIEKDKIKKDKISFDECSKIKLNDSSKIYNPQGIVIQNPAVDQIYVYFYRPNYVVNSAVRCNIQCNDKSITELKNNSYALLKLKPGKYEFYWRKKSRTMVTIEGSGGQIFFIQCNQTGDVTMSNGGFGGTGGLDFTLQEDKSFFNKIRVLQSKKVSEILSIP